jgi:chromosome partitioning protein
MDVLAKVDPITLKVISPSIYSEMIWKQKMERAARDGFSIEWIVVRNRLNNVDAQNKRNVFAVLNELSKRVSFKIAPGFTERVIFKELFLHGITLLDVGKTNYAKSFTPSNVAARQELREFMSYIDVEQIINLKKDLNNKD